MTWTSIDFSNLPEVSKRKVKAFVTSRADGVSKVPYDSFNLATHVGDDAVDVMTNRAILRSEMGLPSQPFWLHQTHTNECVEIPYQYRPEMACDASFTSLENHVCVVMTADCLPVLLCNEAGTEVAAIHAGWRGLANGIIENTVAKMKSDGTELHAYLGPAIGPSAFEVGQDVRDAFVNLSPLHADGFVNAQQDNKYWCDIYLLARQKLAALGVAHVDGGENCTFSEPEQYFSYRRDGQTGRLASLIWLESEQKD